MKTESLSKLEKRLRKENKNLTENEIQALLQKVRDERRWGR